MQACQLNGVVFGCPKTRVLLLRKVQVSTVPIMRYSDVLLMLAEAENELNGPTDLAKDALKQVRERAFVNSSKKTEKVDNYVNALADKTSFFEAIVNERVHGNSVAK